MRKIPKEKEDLVEFTGIRHCDRKTTENGSDVEGRNSY